MSGCSYDYIYSKLWDECGLRMYDAEMNEMIEELCIVLKDLEWWQSGDGDEEQYRKALTKFKDKWFKGDREKRLKGSIDEQIGIVKRELYHLIGEKT